MDDGSLNSGSHQLSWIETTRFFPISVLDFVFLFLFSFVCGVRGCAYLGGVCVDLAGWEGLYLLMHEKNSRTRVEELFVFFKRDLTVG